MKRSMRTHPKLKKFARKLGVEIATAAGYLEFLWGFTADMCPAGDVGRFDDDDIAEAATFPSTRPAEDLISALIACRLLDEHPTHRLIVHDWSEHADRAVHRKLQYQRGKFADGTLPFSRIRKGEDEAKKELNEVICETMVSQNGDFVSQRDAIVSQYARAQPEPEPEARSQKPAAARPPGPARACAREAAAALSDALHQATPSEPRPPGPKILKRITEAMGDMPAEDVVANLRDFARRRTSPKGYGFWPDVVSDWAKTHATKPPICPKCRGDGVIYLPVPEDATTDDIDAGKYKAPCDCKKLTAGATA